MRRELSPRVGSLIFKKMAEPVRLRDNSAADGVRAFRVFCGQVPVTVSVRAAVLAARRTIFVSTGRITMRTTVEIGTI